MNWTPEEYDRHIRKATQTRQARPGRTPVAPVALKGFDPFVALCEAHRLPKPAKEFRFYPGRRWKFDYAWEAWKVALEVEGGAFTQGRHTRGQGFIDDMEKYNGAVLLGWKLLRFTPEQLGAGQCLPALRILLG